VVGRRLYSCIRHHRGPTNDKSRICFYHCIILTLLWHRVLIFIYCPEWRGFKSIVPFKAFTTIQCTQTKSTCKMKGPYSTPRLAMKGWRIKAVFQNFTRLYRLFWLNKMEDETKENVCVLKHSKYLSRWIYHSHETSSNFQRIHF